MELTIYSCIERRIGSVWWRSPSIEDYDRFAHDDIITGGVLTLLMESY